MRQVYQIDCLDWLVEQKPKTIHAVCTDPPYGLVEFSASQIEKLRNGHGGIWRIPPAFDGKKRNPLPRFSILSLEQKKEIEIYFYQWAKLLLPSLVPGAHVLVASNPTLCPFVFHGLIKAGLEPRATIARLYHGFRGGDRPKNAEKEFPDLCVSPRGNYEPWLLFRRVIEERTIAQNLRKWGVGALRMLEGNKPIPDVIPSSKTPIVEKKIANHPSLKPQQLLRLFCRMLMPTSGNLLDPYMGSGSTIAACHAIGIDSIGLEIDDGYFSMSQQAIPSLAKLYPNYKGEQLEMEQMPTKRCSQGSYELAPNFGRSQLSLLPDSV